MKGNAVGVTIPQAALRALGWERGQHLLLYLHNNDGILIVRFDPQKRPDLLHVAREAEAKLDEVLPTIKS